MADEFVERDSRGVRDIDRGLFGTGRQPRELIAALAPEPPYTPAFGAEHECYALAEIERRQRLRGALVEPANTEAGVLQAVERARDAALASAPAEGGAPCMGRTTASAPKALAERSTAPTLCGSLI